VETTRAGVFIARRYQLAIYDSIIVASALMARCTDLWKEDKQNGLVIEERLTIRNPFI
jgi:predicted nucleic acid-binding protein